MVVLSGEGDEVALAEHVGAPVAVDVEQDGDAVLLFWGKVKASDLVSLPVVEIATFLVFCSCNRVRSRARR